MQMKPNFTVDSESFLLLRDEVKIGKIVRLPPEDAGLLAPHIPTHCETVYAAASGIPIQNDLGVFRKGDTLVAIEWVRTESRPMKGEPECNLYRYLFGLTPDGKKCLGYNVTRMQGNDGSGQVGDHWTEYDEVFVRHFKNP